MRTPPWRGQSGHCTRHTVKSPSDEIDVKFATGKREDISTLTRSRVCMEKYLAINRQHSGVTRNQSAVRPRRVAVNRRPKGLFGIVLTHAG